SVADDAPVSSTVGVSLTLVTVIVNASSKKRPPWSVLRIRTVYELSLSKSNEALARRLGPEMLKAPLSARPGREALGEGVAGVGIGRAERADGGVGAGVLGDRAVRQGDVGRRLVDVGD